MMDAMVQLMTRSHEAIDPVYLTWNLWMTSVSIYLYMCTPLSNYQYKPNFLADAGRYGTTDDRKPWRVWPCLPGWEPVIDISIDLSIYMYSTF